MLTERRAPIVEFNRVSFVIGIMMLLLTVFMIPPAVSDIIADNPDWKVFAGSAFITGFFGMMLVMMSRSHTRVKWLICHPTYYTRKERVICARSKSRLTCWNKLMS